MEDHQLFYKSLATHTIPLENLFEDARLFKQIPEDWHIVVVDVEKSTEAVKNGFHHEVNLTATGSIIVVLNELNLGGEKSYVPYFFGGDGATFILPGSLLKKVLSVLVNFRHHVKESMHLNLRVGSVPVREVYSANRGISIAKVSVSPFLVIPIALGTGLKHAESLVKASFVEKEPNLEELFLPNLEGMECRWKEIEAPKRKGKITCLIVDCPDEELQIEIYRKIIAKTNLIFGNYEQRQPITIGKLKIDLTIRKIRRELSARMGKYTSIYLIKNWLISVFGRYYFRYFREGKEYLEKISQLSYTLMVDGTLNSVISGTQEEIDELALFLDELEGQNKIRYGIHTTHASIMSCYVQDRKEKHIHFVDGTEGGFTTAAIMFKGKAR